MPTLRTGTVGVAVVGGGLIGVAAPNLVEYSGVPGSSLQALYTLSPGDVLPPGMTLAQKAVGTGTTNQFGWKGVPTEVGVWTVTVVNAGGGSAGGGGEYQWTIGLASGCPLIDLDDPATPLDDVLAGQALAIQFHAVNGAGGYGWDVAEWTALPDGLSLSIDGLLTGAATTPGDYTFTIRATDDNDCPGVRIYTLSVLEPPPIEVLPETVGPLARDEHATPPIVFTAEGGIGGLYTFAITAGALPTGMALFADGSTEGFPTEAGTFPVTIQATDAASNTGARAYVIVVTGLRVTIEDVDVTREISYADFELVLNRRSEARLVLGDETIPARGAAVVLYARDGVTPLLDGLILTRSIQGMTTPSGPANQGDLAIVDYSLFFDDASVTLAHAAAVALEDVIDEIVDLALGDYGITYTPTATGITLEPFSWVDVSVTEAFKRITDATGVVFRERPVKVLDVFQPGVPYFAGTAEQFLIQQAEYARWVSEGDARRRTVFEGDTLADYATIVEGVFQSVLDGLAWDEHAQLVAAADAIMWGPAQGFSGSLGQWFLQQLEFARFVPLGDPRRQTFWPLSEDLINTVYPGFYAMSIAPGLTSIIADMTVDERAALDAAAVLAENAFFVGTEEQFFLQQAEYARWMPAGDARRLTGFGASTLTAYGVLMDGSVADDFVVLLDAMEAGDRAAVTDAYARATDPVEGLFTGTLEQLLIQQAEYYRYLQEGDRRLLVSFSGDTLEAYATVYDGLESALAGVLDDMAVDERAAFDAGYAAAIAALRAPVVISDTNINAFDLAWQDGAALPANTVDLLCGPSGQGIATQRWTVGALETSWEVDIPAVPGDAAPVRAAYAFLGASANYTAGETVTLGASTYTFRTSLVGDVAGEVLIGADAEASLANLIAAITDAGGSGYAPSTPVNASATAYLRQPDQLAAQALTPGVAGNAIAVAAAAAASFWYGEGTIPTSTFINGADASGAAGWTQGYVLEDEAVARPIGEVGSGAYYEWDVTSGRGTVTLGSGSAPPAGTVLELKYLALYPFHARYSTGSPPRTYRETHPEIVSYAEGVALAQAIAARESVDKRELEIVTDVDGFLPGQALEVDTTHRGGIVGTFLVASVRGTIVNAHLWEYRITAQQSAQYQGSYVEQWKQLVTGSGGGAAPGALVAGGAIGAGTGDVIGPGVVVDGEAVLFAGTTGTRLQRATGTGVVHRTAGVDAVGAVVEADLTLADVTTANVSTAAHGFVPKAPGDATKFLNGDDPPAWTVPAGSGGALTQIAQIVTSGSQATVDFIAIPGTYISLEVRWSSRDTQGGTASVAARLRLNNDATAGNYTAAAYTGIQNGTALNATLAASAGGVFCFANVQDGNTAGIACQGFLSIEDYTNTTWHKRMMSRYASDDGTTNLTNLMLSARWKSTAAITRLTFTTDGTAFKNGSVFTLYGRN